MLRIEAYPVMGGLTVVVIGVPLPPHRDELEGWPARVTRTISVETLEGLGVEEALRDVIQDVFNLYPGMAMLALR